MRRTTIAIALAVMVGGSGSAQESALRWYKGNTHTHTLNSDGDSTPDQVVRWYREHGYQFLVLTDHNFVTSVDGLNALHGADEQFLVIPGEEVTDRFGEKSIHVNGLNLAKLVEPQGGTSVADTIQRDVDAIVKERGVPHVNHPNFGWAITVEDLKQIRNYKLLEIYNGHPLVNNDGGGGRPSVEAVWDVLLSSGIRVYGIAVDDAHHFKRPEDREASRPGRGWVVVRAGSLSAPALLAAMERGDFYASTGVELKDIRVSAAELTIEVRLRGDTRQTTRFIGRDGKILQESGTSPAVYKFRGDELYVRARIADSNGYSAWTQPVFPKSKTGSR